MQAMVPTAPSPAKNSVQVFPPWWATITIRGWVSYPASTARLRVPQLPPDASAFVESNAEGTFSHVGQPLRGSVVRWA
jgi:hypothetical protein